MKATTLAVLLALAGSVTAQAETVSCTGYTDSTQQTQVVLSINPQKQPGEIRFISSISSVTQGLNLSDVYYPAPNVLRYADSGGFSHLDFVIEGGVIKKNSFTHGLYFADAELDCKITGQIPSAPSCGVNPSETLVDVIREGRSHQTLRAVNYQLACGADANFTDKYGCTPLLYAFDQYCGGNTKPAAHAFTDLTQIIDRILSEGAYVDIVDPKKKETALLKAARLGVRDVYDSFIAAEADFNFQDKDGMTPLMWSAFHGDAWTVKDILAARPDRRLKNKKGQTAFDIASHWQKESVIDLVRIPDAIIEVKGANDGTCTPLTIEAQEGQTIEIVLKATSQMFKFDAAQLGVDLMANGNDQDSQIVKLDRTGTYDFTCGFHHAGTYSTGQIVVK